MAAATALTPIAPPPIHSATVMANAPAVIFSLRVRGPHFSSCFLAISGASAFEGEHTSAAHRLDARVHSSQHMAQTTCSVGASHEFGVCNLSLSQITLVPALPSYKALAPSSDKEFIR